MDNVLLHNIVKWKKKIERVKTKITKNQKGGSVEDIERNTENIKVINDKLSDYVKTLNDISKTLETYNSSVENTVKYKRLEEMSDMWKNLMEKLYQKINITDSVDDIFIIKQTDDPTEYEAKMKEIKNMVENEAKIDKAIKMVQEANDNIPSIYNMPSIYNFYEETVYNTDLRIETKEAKNDDEYFMVIPNYNEFANLDITSLRAINSTLENNKKSYIIENGNFDKMIETINGTKDLVDLFFSEEYEYKKNYLITNIKIATEPIVASWSETPNTSVLPTNASSLIGPLPTIVPMALQSQPPIQTVAKKLQSIPGASGVLAGGGLETRFVDNKNKYDNPQIGIIKKLEMLNDLVAVLNSKIDAYKKIHNRNNGYVKFISSLLNSHDIDKKIIIYSLLDRGAIQYYLKKCDEMLKDDNDIYYIVLNKTKNFLSFLESKLEKNYVVVLDELSDTLKNDVFLFNSIVNILDKNIIDTDKKTTHNVILTNWLDSNTFKKQNDKTLIVNIPEEEEYDGNDYTPQLILSKYSKYLKKKTVVYHSDNVIDEKTVLGIIKNTGISQSIQKKHNTMITTYGEHDINMIFGKNGIVDLLISEFGNDYVKVSLKIYIVYGTKTIYEDSEKDNVLQCEIDENCVAIIFKDTDINFINNG